MKMNADTDDARDESQTNEDAQLDESRSVAFRTDEEFYVDFERFLSGVESKRLTGKIKEIVSTAAVIEDHTYRIEIEHRYGDSNLTDVSVKPTPETTWWNEGESTTVCIHAILGPRGGARLLSVRDDFTGSKGDYSEQSPIWRNFKIAVSSIDCAWDDIDYDREIQDVQLLPEATESEETLVADGGVEVYDEEVDGDMSGQKAIEEYGIDFQEDETSIKVIKIRWSGYARSRIGEYQRQYELDGWTNSTHGYRPDRYIRVSNRLKTQIVMKSVEEAEAVYYELGNYHSSQRTWMNAPMDSAINRVKNEIVEAMEERGFKAEFNRSGTLPTFLGFKMVAKGPRDQEAATDGGVDITNEDTIVVEKRNTDDEVVKVIDVDDYDDAQAIVGAISMVGGYYGTIVEIDEERPVDELCRSLPNSVKDYAAIDGQIILSIEGEINDPPEEVTETAREHGFTRDTSHVCDGEVDQYHFALPETNFVFVEKQPTVVTDGGVYIEYQIHSDVGGHVTEYFDRETAEDRCAELDEEHPGQEHYIVEKEVLPDGGEEISETWHCRDCGHSETVDPTETTLAGEVVTETIDMHRGRTKDIQTSVCLECGSNQWNSETVMGMAGIASGAVDDNLATNGG